jgi:hypothetical protein
VTPEEKAVAEAKAKAVKVFEEVNKAALPDKIPARKDIK